jgi:uncharacterized protein with HEPN domain
LLEDIARPCGNITRWTGHLTADDYRRDQLVHHAVERKFEIIGEALLRLERTDLDTARGITGYRAVIGFRNRIA